MKSNALAIDLAATMFLPSAAGAAEVTDVAARQRYPRNSLVDSRDKVQLWEGGPYWATVNIGAENPWEAGYYFWWGDTVGYKRVNNAWAASDGSTSNFSFSASNTSTYNKSVSTLRSEGWIVTENGTDVLAPEHDAAQVQWGDGWRMPTLQELSALNCNCTWTWTTQNGVNGYIVRGQGDFVGNSIFLPIAGYGSWPSLNHSGCDGNYWSSVLGSDNYGNAWSLYFFDSGGPGGHFAYRTDRYYGQSVRPVLGFTK